MSPAPKKSRGSAGSLRSQQTVRLTQAGIAMLLGDLEQRVIEAAWGFNAPASSREIYARVSSQHEIAYITAVTVANRLVKKGLLAREKVDGVFHYRATLTREEFLERASRHVMRRVLGLGSRAVAVSLVDALSERDPDQLAELGRLVRRKLKEQG